MGWRCIVANVIFWAACQSQTFRRFPGEPGDDNGTDSSLTSGEEAEAEVGNESEGESSTEKWPKNADPDPDCGGEEIAIELDEGLPPDILLVVDRSGSMAEPLLESLFGPPTSWESKWQIMREALIGVTSTFGSGIYWGLLLYPTDDNCGAGAVTVPVGPDTADDIEAALLSTGPTGWTPTDTSLAEAHETLIPLAPDTRYVVLATDGMPGCERDEETGFDRQPSTLAQVEALAADGIQTFVIGFGGAISADPAFLADLAEAGGTGSAFTADSSDALIAALDTIAGGVLPPPCTYTLASEPPDPELVTVTFDGEEVPRDLSSVDGWNYDGSTTTVTFYGSYCERLRREVDEVEFVYGCRGIVIE